MRQDPPRNFALLTGPTENIIALRNKAAKYHIRGRKKEASGSDNKYYENWPQQQMVSINGGSSVFVM